MSIERPTNGSDIKKFVILVIGIALFSAFCLLGNAAGWPGF